MPLLLRFRVSGHSMKPLLSSGNKIIVSSLPYIFGKPKVGDVIAFCNDGKFIVKRIKEIKNGSLRVQGDNKQDSKDFGWIKNAEILGKMIYSYA